jgi:hypothetical protein
MGGKCPRLVDEGIGICAGDVPWTPEDGGCDSHTHTKTQRHTHTHKWHTHKWHTHTDMHTRTPAHARMHTHRRSAYGPFHCICHPKCFF